MYSYLSHWMQSWNILHIVKDNKTYKAIKQATFSYFILYRRKTPGKRKLPIREKKGATNFSLIRSFDCTSHRNFACKFAFFWCQLKKKWRQNSNHLNVKVLRLISEQATRSISAKQMMDSFLGEGVMSAQLLFPLLHKITVSGESEAGNDLGCSTASGKDNT